ncbi:MAG: hypothetical protein MZW92_24315, partial [Comamonadaceae bacterium]|nr:hypothetical protein [Comamonadaceae bacterium]
HRPADEGRPRHELHRAKNADGVTVNRWTHDRLPRRLGVHQRDRATSPTRSSESLGMVALDNQARV